jgi:hypothetical protein
MNEITFSEKVTDILYNVIKKTNTFEKVETLMGRASIFVFITSVLSALTLNKLNNVNTIFKRENRNIYDFDIEILKINNKLDKIIENNEKIILFMNNKFKNREVIIENTSVETNKARKNSIIDDEELINDCYDNIPYK